MSFLLIHLWVQPFDNKACNQLESMSLFCLTVLAALLAGATDVTTTNVCCPPQYFSLLHVHNPCCNPNRWTSVPGYKY
jgi:hypothetical protein